MHSPLFSSLTSINGVFQVLCSLMHAGASGCLGIVCAVSGRGTAMMSSYAASLGLDAPVEVVNLAEVWLESKLDATNPRPLKQSNM